MGRPRKQSSSHSPVSKKITSLEGVVDVLTESDLLWEAVIKRMQRFSRVYGFSQVHMPLVEDPRLYEQFFDRDVAMLGSLVTFQLCGQSAALRPSLLPGVLRSYAENKIHEKLPLSKWMYYGKVMSQNPQRGPVEDYEFGFEVLGEFNHLTEAQLVSAVWEFLNSLGLSDLVLEINNIGTAECQESYQDTLHGFLSGKKYELCDECNEHLSARVLNVLRCGSLDCQAVLAEAPTILDFLDPQSHKYFTCILEALDELGVPYQLNPFYAGPGGYSRTNFSIKHRQKSSSVTVGEGGYHNMLMQNISGKNHSSFGFTGSLTAVRGLLDAQKISPAKEIKNEVFLVPLGELASKKSLRLFRDLTNEKISVYDHFGSVGVKNQLKLAEIYKAPIALIMGQKEAMDEVVILRDVKSGMQEIISYDKIVDEVKKRLGK